MRLKVPTEQVTRLKKALRSAGKREIGGQIFGEQLAVSNFIVTDLTFQTKRGSFAQFFVDVLQAAKDAAKFFDRTRHQYSRFNYIGEWHSHPSFAVAPSRTDAETMHDLASDPDFRGTFAVLMIVRLDNPRISAGAWVFDPAGSVEDVLLELVDES